MIEIQDLSTFHPTRKLTILLVGKEKSGKSRCASTAPEPVLFFDFDLRAQALAGIKGLHALTFRDPSPQYQPTAFNDMLDILTKLEGGADLRDLGFATVDKGIKPATIVADSATTMAKAAGRYGLYTNSDIRRRLSFGSWSVDFVKNFDGWNAEMTTIENVTLRMLALPFHFITTLHEMEEESEDSKPDQKKLTGRIGPFPARYQLLFKYFNELWHCDQAQSDKQWFKPRVQIKPDYRCPWAATNMLLDEMFISPPDIKAMVKKHLSIAPVLQVVTPTQPQLPAQATKL